MRRPDFPSSLATKTPRKHDFGDHELNQRLAERTKGCAKVRRIGHAQSQFRSDCAANKKPIASRFARLLDELIDDTAVTTEDILLLAEEVSGYVRRRRAGPALTLLEAYSVESRAEGEANPAQWQAVITRSEGDLERAKALLLHQREQTDAAILATDRELTERRTASQAAMAMLRGQR